jgi:hypothetical protein
MSMEIVRALGAVAATLERLRDAAEKRGVGQKRLIAIDVAALALCDTALGIAGDVATRGAASVPSGDIRGAIMRAAKRGAKAGGKRTNPKGARHA